MSRRTIAKLTEALEARNNILKQILQMVDHNTLPEQTKHDISQLAETSWSHVAPSPAATVDSTQSTAPISDPLQEDETGDHEWTETYASQSSMAPVGDDINGLASQRPNKSYMRAFSPGAVLRVLLAISPQARNKFTQLEHALVAEQPSTGSTSDAAPQPYLVQQQSAVDAYFSRIHLILPMVDETWFRSTFLEQRRVDDSWAALSNLVLALGSIASGDDETHFVYHRNARQAIGYNVFCSGNLEMLQALVLLGGLYLHYTNSPNSAYMVRGTAFRMAIAMGLHRESVISAQLHPASTSEAQQGNASIPRSEIRRRTWWSLVNSDVLGALLSGRPKALGWDSLTMDVKLPSIHPGQSEHQHHPTTDAEWVTTILRLRSEFSGILSEMQGRVALVTRVTAQEIITLHEQLQAWVRLHLLNHNLTRSCPKSIKRHLEIQHIYAHNASLIFSQPHLLYLAVDSQGQRTMTSDDWRVISICQDAASNIIAALASRHSLNRVMVWHSTFHLFQACLILMLSVVLAPRLSSPQAMIQGWRQSLETARHCFKRMAPFTRRSDRYGEIFDGLYGVVTAVATGRQQPLTHNAYDEINRFTATAGINSDHPPDFTEFAYDGFPYDFDFAFNFEQPAFGDFDFYHPGNEDMSGWY